MTFHQTPVIAQSADLVGVTGLAFLPTEIQKRIRRTGLTGQMLQVGQLCAVEAPADRVGRVTRAA